MAKKPGVMIYFDILETLRRLSDEEAGILFRAIMEYGATRQMPDLPGPLVILWPLIQMRLDFDDQRYRETTQKRRYATYCRDQKNRGQTPLPFSQWLQEVADTEEELPYYETDII